MDVRRMSLRGFVVTAFVLIAAIQMCCAANLLTNPGFESIVWFEAPGYGVYPNIAGWNFECDTPNSEGACFGTGLNFFPNRTGNNNLVYINWTGKVAAVETGYLRVYQDVAVSPGSLYRASVWVKTTNVGGWIPPVFGDTATDSAGLKIIEMRADNTVVYQRPKQEIKAATNAWVQVSDEFTASSETVKVRFMLDTVSAAQYNCCPVGSWVQYDDCILDAPAPPAALSGTVTSAGSDLPGVSVEAQGKNDVTSSSGSYSIAGLDSSLTTVRAGKAGYFAQRKSRTLASGVTTVLDFDLTQIGDNLLVNAGFDDGWNTGWKTRVVGAAEVQSESWSYQWGPIEGIKPLVFYDSGEEGVALLGHAAGTEARIFQSPTVVPGAEYIVRCRFHATEDTRAGLPPSAWGDPNDDHRAALYVQEYDKFGAPIGTERRAYADETKDWETLEMTFTADSQARFVEIGGWASFVNIYDLNLERATFDSFELNGLAGTPMPPLYGKVTSGDIPLPGAFVELVGTVYATVTEEDGYWSVNVPAGSYTIRVGKPGYYTQGKTRTAPATCLVDLVPLNLLANAGFDDGGIDGWTRAWDQPGNSYIWPEQSRSDAQYHSGESAMFIAAMSGSATSRVFQDVPVRGGQSYIARAWMRPVGASWGWGEYQNSAFLFVEEYDALGNQIGATRTAGPTITPETVGQWQQIEMAFTSSSQIVKMRVGAEAFLSDTYSTGARVTWDDFELNGPAGTFGLHGAVAGAGGPIAGARVEANNQTALPQTTQVISTGATGAYSVPSPVFGHRYRVRASSPGYFAQQKSRIINSDLALDYSLVPVGGNLMVNAGFDDGLFSGGWKYIQFGGGGRAQGESFTALWSPHVYYHSGEEAMEICSSAGLDGGWIYQGIPVQPLSNYTASVWFRAGEDLRYGSSWGVPGDEQKGALYVEEYAADGTAIAGTQRLVYADETTDWEYLSADLTTSFQTASLRVGGYARMLDGYDTTNLARAIFDDFALTGPAASSMTLSAAKAKQDGFTVYLSGKIVSAEYNGFFYIEEPDRTSGIKVIGQASVGSVVTVNGTIGTVQGERTITAAGVTETPGVAPIEPIGLNNRALGEGLNPVGLYVTIWGRVQSADAANGTFTITDGSGAAIKVYGFANAGDYVSVTGAVGAELAGSSVVPVLRAVAVGQVE